MDFGWFSVEETKMSFDHKLLIELHKRYNNGDLEPVSELALQESLGISYKLIHASSEVWIQKKYVKVATKRGGQTAYVLTPEGLFYTELLIRKHKKNRFIAIACCCLGLILMIILLLFVK